MILLLFAPSAREALAAWSEETGIDTESILRHHLSPLATDGLCTVEKADSSSRSTLHLLVSNSAWGRALYCKVGSDGTFSSDFRPFH